MGCDCTLRESCAYCIPGGIGDSERRIAELESWNSRVSVCRNHTAEVVDGDCLVCRIAELEAELNKLNATNAELEIENGNVQRAFENTRDLLSAAEGKLKGVDDLLEKAMNFPPSRRSQTLCNLYPQMKEILNERQDDGLQEQM